MNVLFATGSDSAFFNSLLVCLQAFAERMPDCRLFVCDFGLTDAQSQFLRGLGLWLDRPPALRSSGPFRCKAALLRYLLHNGKKVEDYDAIVWLDADLTLMEVSKIDFQAVIDDMGLARAEVALCHAGINVSQVISLFGEVVEDAALRAQRRRRGNRRQPAIFLHRVIFLPLRRCSEPVGRADGKRH